ncbi:MAG: M16 family metallopeptidase [Acidimicrobiales bacterium]
MTDADVPVEIPKVGKPRPFRLPAVVDTTLANGLRVLVARRAGIPRFECRLVVPITTGTDGRDAARLRVLTETVLSGTPDRSSQDIAQALQAMGAGLGASIDADQLMVGGSSLSMRRRPFLQLFGEVVERASFPADEVEIERDRVVQEIALLRSQPGSIASDALVRRMYGTHPYGWGTPDADAVAGVGAATLRRLHRQRVLPGESVLVLVGDLDAERAIADIDAAFAGWGTGPVRRAVRVPSVDTPAAVLLVDRPGAVQTTIRLGGPAISRHDAAYPALALAVTVFSGYFTSRLNDNIREQKGYTYGAHSRIEQRRAAAQITISTDVGREVTAPALVEIDHELGRMVASVVEQEELDAARRYLQGSLSMGVQTQAGLCAYLAMLVSSGLPVTYLRDYPAALENVTVDAVRDAACRFLAPRSLARVLVGDAATVAPTIAPLYDIERP